MAQTLRRRRVIVRREHPELAGALDHLIDSGRLTPVLPGVYARPPADDLETRILAAMAWNRDCVLIGTAAARCWFWPEIACPTVELAVPARVDLRRAGFRFVRRTIDPDLVAEWDGVRMTVPALTALDLSEQLGGDAMDEALRRGAVRVEDLERVLEATPRRRGNALRRQLVFESRDRPWSPPERRLHRLLRVAGLRGWRANVEVRVRGWSCHPDVAFDDVLLALEVDGREHHNTAEAFEKDHRRQNRLVRAGWTVLRFTPRMIDTEPEEVIATIAETLAALQAAQLGEYRGGLDARTRKSSTRGTTPGQLEPRRGPDLR